VHYGVFGLGNKQYEHFNAVGKKMQANMEALGATPVCRRGDGDDDDSIDDDFEKWCVDLFAALDAKPELLGAAAEGGGSDTLAAYRVEMLPAGGCWCLAKHLTNDMIGICGRQNVGKQAAGLSARWS
jgi:NADPH-ferrihemoprotein reductase